MTVNLTFKKGSDKSGHYGHAGRPGQQGGSKPSGAGTTTTEPKSGQADVSHFSPGKERDARRAKGIYDIISETDEETAKILLTQGVEPSFKPDIPEVTEYAPGRGAEREGLYTANQEAFSKGSFGKVRLYLTTKLDTLKSPREMEQLGRKNVDDVLRTENGAITVGVLPKSVFQAVEVNRGGKWVIMSPGQYLKSIGLSGNVPKLPSVPTYRSWLKKNASSFHLSTSQVDEISNDYNRASLEDKIWMSEEAGLI